MALRAGRTGATVDKFEGCLWIDRCADAWSATDVRPHRQTTRAEHQLYTRIDTKKDKLTLWRKGMDMPIVLDGISHKALSALADGLLNDK